MAEENSTKLVREYVIPLRRRWLLVPAYRRAGKAARTIKIFIAKHMKVIDRDVDNVRLDNYLNNQLWFRGVANPPAKIKVRATKEGDIVRVELAELPQQLKFAKLKHEKFHSQVSKKEAKEAKPETKEEKAEKVEEKKAEVEKEKAGAEKAAKEAKIESKAEKHITGMKEQQIHRKALKR